jgi:hypothetical protein
MSGPLAQAAQAAAMVKKVEDFQKTAKATLESAKDTVHTFEENPGVSTALKGAVSTYLPLEIPGAEPKVWPPTPSPWYYLLYFLLLPLAPAAMAIAGDTNNALTRIAFLTIVPFGFFIGMLASINDYFITFANPKAFFENGTQRFPPFSWCGMDPDSNSPNITKPSKKVACAPPSIFAVMAGVIGSMIGKFIQNSPAVRALDGIAVSAAKTAEAALGKAENAIDAVNVKGAVAKLTAAVPAVPAIPGGEGMAAAGALAGGLQNPMGAVGGLLPQMPQMPQMPGMQPPQMPQPQMPQPQMPQMPQMPQGLGTQFSEIRMNPATGKPAGYGTMVGGGEGGGQGQLTSFDTLILTGLAALLGASAFLTAGRHAYVAAYGPSDSPPFAGRV